MTAVNPISLPSTGRAAFLATVGVLLSGCHVTVGAPTPASAKDAVHKDVIEQVTAQQVRDQLGGGPVLITCPHDLALKVGDSEECQLAQDGKRFPLTVTITKTSPIDDASWKWHIGQQLNGS